MKNFKKSEDEHYISGLMDIDECHKRINIIGEKI